MITVDIRPYEQRDRPAVMAIFESNVPEFLDAGERADFESYLDRHAGAHLVACDGGLIVGCGGLLMSGDVATLCYGLVHRDRHGAGIGRALTRRRIDVARAAAGVRRVALSTSQKTAGFYARLGFAELARFAGYYGPGLDRVDMELVLVTGDAPSDE